MQELQQAPHLAEPEPADVAHRIVDVAVDRKATDVVMLDLRRLTTFTDYFVVMTGTSMVQLRALAENIEETLTGALIKPLHREGNSEDGWILIDYGSVVVHIFSPDQRTYYGLEELWSNATMVVRIQ